MNELSERERDLLERVKDKAELRPLFFNKVKGLKWFNTLYKEGYFDANKLPILEKGEGYITIPRWIEIEYLSKTVAELVEPAAATYAPKFLEIITQVTTYAKENNFSNYHVWWQFAEILSQIPTKYIESKNLNVIDHWLDDKYELGFVTEVIGVQWLPRLLEENNEDSLSLAYRLIEILFKVVPSLEERTDKSTNTARLRLDHDRAKKFTEKISYLAGKRLGEQAVQLLQSRLTQILDILKNDTSTASWHPAIEDHEQNKYCHDAENIVLTAYRDVLCGYINESPDDACDYVKKLLDSPYQTIIRVAVYCIGNNYQRCHEATEELLRDKFFRDNYRHEIWHFLNKNYPFFTEKQKGTVIEVIQAKELTDKNGSIDNAAIAYERATWLAAIKGFGDKEAGLYQDAIGTAKTEPDHPDFSSYFWGVSSVVHKSPYSVKELAVLSGVDLINKLKDYKGGDGWREPGIEGLANAVKQLFKTDPLKYYNCLSQFLDIDLAYIYSIIVAYSELWDDKANLPWDEIWPHLLRFIHELVKEDRFWSSENSEQREEFVANQHWVVGAIARLLESGTKSDSRAYPDECHDSVGKILEVLLKNAAASKRFDTNSDAVSISINSPRGKCIQALINLTLHACRKESSSKNGDHSAAWEKYRSYFDSEFERADKEKLEFATLVTLYLPNFLYMAEAWVMDRIHKIFDQSDYLKWSCAMQGYAYANTFYEDIYSYLKKHGDFVRVLDSEDINNLVKERVIQHIVIMYIKDLEKINEKDSLINSIMKRFQPDELRYLIWFLWTLRKEEENKKLRSKVYELWSVLYNRADTSTKEDRQLASRLCHWAVFVENIDEERKNWLTAIAPYADEEHNSYQLLEALAKISEQQPFEANEVWQSMLKESAPNYPEDAIQKLLENLVRKGFRGEMAAKETVDMYIHKGSKRPSNILKDIMRKIKISKRQGSL